MITANCKSRRPDYNPLIGILWHHILFLFILQFLLKGRHISYGIPIANLWKRNFITGCIILLVSLVHHQSLAYSPIPILFKSFKEKKIHTKAKAQESNLVSSHGNN